MSRASGAALLALLVAASGCGSSSKGLQPVASVSATIPAHTCPVVRAKGSPGDTRMHSPAAVQAAFARHGIDLKEEPFPLPRGVAFFVFHSREFVDPNIDGPVLSVEVGRDVDSAYSEYECFRRADSFFTRLWTGNVVVTTLGEFPKLVSRARAAMADLRAGGY